MHSILRHKPAQGPWRDPQMLAHFLKCEKGRRGHGSTRPPWGIGDNPA